MLTVVVPGVLNVGLEALDGAHAGHGSLGAEAQEGKHGEARVLELLDLLLVGGHAHGVKGVAAEEAGLAGLLEALDALGLKDGHDGHLNGNEGRGGESVLLGACLPPVAEAEGIGEEDASNGSHGPAAVHQLSLAVVGQELGVATDAKGVEAVVTSCKIRGIMSQATPTHRNLKMSHLNKRKSYPWSHRGRRGPWRRGTCRTHDISRS